jgi:purine-binding chemotaxis protein CheW
VSELFLIAQVAGRWVAIESAQVDSVVDIGDVVPVPRAGDRVRGLAALRSRVITVIDTHVALGVPPRATSGRAVIAQMDGHHYAFLVDALEDVAPFERQPLATGIADGRWSAASAGVVIRDDEPLMVLDLAQLLPAVCGANA